MNKIIAIKDQLLPTIIIKLNHMFHVCTNIQKDNEFVCQLVQHKV